MKPQLGRRAEAGLTLLEVAVIVAILVVLAALLLSGTGDSYKKNAKINCINNLKQIGLACRIWESDSADTFPMGISVTNGGSLEMVATGDVVQTFQVMSNQLSSAKILVCPKDKAGASTAGNSLNWHQPFTMLSRSNISYFVGIDVTNEANPQFILSGDSDLEIAAKPAKCGLLSLWTNDPVTWSGGRHGHGGNLLLADGSVQGPTDIGLRIYLVNSGVSTNRLAIP